ncbi:hypothetical protein J4760_00615 [Salinicoccus sp. ID82-1]|uniref:MT0933-like antitoxin protein n=1 Tax=Salinicoccus cyprini TaxID=2493691 RepID=A0A558AXQ2_9STAP|nr:MULTISPECIES: hypothetical protein [Salinicoccus]MCG1008544.1 hypothetical protein [Salinicoccus sp. ID82-1]TVT29025.1 hypothetical protein FO441_01745 [Salinicoccus cyprini]
MAENNKGLFDKAKDAVNNFKSGDGSNNKSVKDTWDSVKEKGDQVVDRFGNNDDSTEKSTPDREVTQEDTTTRAGDDHNDKGNDGSHPNR